MGAFRVRLLQTMGLGHMLALRRQGMGGRVPVDGAVSCGATDVPAWRRAGRRKESESGMRVATTNGWREVVWEVYDGACSVAVFSTPEGAAAWAAAQEKPGLHVALKPTVVDYPDEEFELHGKRAVS